MIIALAFWIVVLGVTILNLAATPRLRPVPLRRGPRVSVIVPARDEERTIGRTVRALLAQTYPDLEIIVVNDRSEDGTGAIVAGFDGIVVVQGEEPPPGWLGKPWALHQGSLRASGELLLFVDADVIYEPGTIAAAVEELDRQNVALLALLPRIEMRGFWEHVIMPNLGAVAFMAVPLWMLNRTRAPMLAMGGGPGNLVTRAAYDAARGHETLKDAVVDDIGLARLMRKTGHRTGVVRADDYVSVRMYHGLGEIVGGFTKNAFAVFGYNYVAATLYLAVAVALNIVPYALAAAGDALAIATVAVIALARLILFTSLGYRLDSALLGHPLMVGAWCWILVRSMWFTGVRRQVRWRRRVYGR